MNDISPLDPTIPGAVWRYKWLVMLLVIVGAALAVAYATFTSPVFKAKAELLVEDPSTASLFDAPSGAQLERYVANQVQILDSPVVETRAEELILIEDPAFTGDVSEMSAIEGDRDNSLIVIRVQSDERAEAQLVANAIVQAYQEIKEQAADKNANDALAELQAILDVVDAELDDLLNEFAGARSAGDVREELDAQFNAATERLVEVQEELVTTTDPDRAQELRLQLGDLLLQIDTFQAIQLVENTNPALSLVLQELQSTLDRRDALELRRDQIVVDSQLVSSGIDLASPARLPSGDGREEARAAVIGGVAGTFVALLLAYSLAIRRRSFSNRSEPELIVDAPLISEVPRFSDEGIKTALPVQDMPQTRTAEAFRFAAAALDIQSAGSSVKSLVIVSGNAGDGKTTAVANSAMALAREGNRVLVIDADFGSQNLSQLLVGNVPPAAGVTEVVETGTSLRQAIVRVPVTDGTSLSLLARGHRSVIASNFFRSAATRVFFEGIRGEFDLVLIDTPPLLHVAYASVIARYADAALLVVNHGGAVSELEEVADRLAFIGTQPLGYIYNRSPLRTDQADVEGSLKDILGAGSPNGQQAPADKPKKRLRGRSANPK
ncbi:MAG: AAA family ATPase [Acidimicrobiia bacterium]